MGARNQVGIGLSYRPASLCNLATQFQTRFLESIPRPIAGLKFPTLKTNLQIRDQLEMIDSLIDYYLILRRKFFLIGRFFS
jgi:hypothetical protein